MNYIKNICVLFLVAFTFSCSKEKQSLKAGEKMQQFVMDISQYARSAKPGFIIIPQNGVELAYNQLDSSNGLRTDYLNAIDAVAMEELFYNETLITDPYRLNLLQPIKEQKTILVADYLGNDGDLNNAISLNQVQGFLCFPRVHANYYYNQIPNFIIDENNNNISSLSEAKNYLYLLSTENYTSIESYLQAIAATNYDVLIIDLFYDDTPLTAEEVAQLKIKNNGAQRLVISYINIGAAEKYRYYWQKGWTLHIPHWLRKKYDGYDDEFYVKFWAKEWQEIIYGNNNSYMKKILDAGFDGAFLDNVEAYYALYYND